MKWTSEAESYLAELVRQYHGEPVWREIAEEMPRRGLQKVSGALCRSHWYRIRKRFADKQAKSPPVNAGKKKGTFDFWEVTDHLEKTQQLLHGASWSQDYSTVDWSHLKKPICVVGLCDLHMGSHGTDLTQLRALTKELLEIDDLYAGLLGDLLQMSINLRSNIEQADNSLPPQQQMDLLESWLDLVKDKVLFSCWDNHSVMREEKATGFSMYKWLMSRRVVYHNGIGHFDLRLGANQVYKFAVSHVFRGRSFINPVHGQMRYARMEAGDREIIMAGDSHVPGMMKYYEQGNERIVLNGGSIQTNSGYAKRHFSLKTSTAFPCVQLFPNEHRAVPYWTVGDWLAATGRK